MKTIAVLTSGGDSPGMNAAIRSIIRGGLYHSLKVYGIIRGYNGMIEGNLKKMTSKSVGNIIQLGGTILKSARSEKFKTKKGRRKAFENLRKYSVDGLVVIGGDGTFKGAEIFYEEYGIPVIGIPGTIDNDLYGTDYTIGFDTAVNTALGALDRIRDTADSHDRIFFVEVMGKDSGYIAVQTGIGCGAEMVMIPEETNDTPEEVINTLRIRTEKAKFSSVVIVAEGEENGDTLSISQKVKEALPNMDIRVSILGHIQRGGSPTALDRLLGSRLGLAAVESLIANQKNIMVGIINNEIEYTSFSDAINKKKMINKRFIEIIDILSGVNLD